MLISCPNFIFTLLAFLAKHNQVADALYHRPRVNMVYIAYYNDLTSMVDDYDNDLNFTNVVFAITMRKTQDPYKVSDGYLIYGFCLCITKNLREKVTSEYHAPPYVGHCGIAATTQAIETYFHWPYLK